MATNAKWSTPNQYPWYVGTNSAFITKTHAASDVLATRRKEFARLTNEMWDYYPIKQLAAKKTLLRRIGKTMRRQIENFYGFPEYVLLMSGSTVSGLATKGSDVDMVILADPLRGQPEQECQRAYLRDLAYRISQDQSFQDLIGGMPLAINASIPLLKFVADIRGHPVECDLSVACNQEAFVSSHHNSFLIRKYVEFDARVAPLCMIVKKWAKNYGVYGPMHCRFNSYAIVMLVLHFLQCGVSPPVIPNLIPLYPGYFACGEQDFPHRVDYHAPPPDPFPEDEPRNESNLGELFYLFCLYYKEFDFAATSIDMRKAEARPRDDRDRDQPQSPLVVLKDPIDTHNPARTVRRKKDDICEDPICVDLHGGPMHPFEQIKDSFSAMVHHFESTNVPLQSLSRLMLENIWGD
ncbi:unnamed protein product, partial [Mesorhabditis spiculigera]